MEKSMERIIKKQEEASIILDNMLAGYMIVTCVSGIVQLEFISEKCFPILGYSREEFYSLCKDDPLAFFFQDNYSEVVKSFVKLTQTMEPEIFEYQLYHRNNEKVYVQMRGGATEPSSKSFELQFLILDITSMKQELINLEIESTIDSLTQVYNQIAVKKLVTEILGNNQGNEKFAFFVIDIDYFKIINDSFGHLFGDAILASVGDEIKSIFAGNRVCGRIGGDEFAVLMPFEQKTDMELLAEKFCERVKRIYLGGEKEITQGVSCSIGISYSTDSNKGYQEVFYEADTALFAVKKGGRGFWESFDETKDYLQEDSDRPSKRKENESICSNGTENSKVHPLLQFTIEFLDKAQDIKSAIHIVLDRVRRYFDIDNVMIVKSGLDEKRAIEYQLCSNEVKPIEEDWNYFGDSVWLPGSSVYTEVGCAVVRKEDLSPATCELVNMKSALSTFTHYGKKSHVGNIIFMNYTKEKQWSLEEKEVLNGLVTIIFGHIARFENVEDKNRQMDYLINYDTLTNLPSYENFKKIAWRIIYEEQEKEYCIIYTDFNNFKYINETYGFALGDAILVRYAQFLKSKYKYGIDVCRITADQYVILVESNSIAKPRLEFIKMCQMFCNMTEKELQISNLTLISGICKIDRDQEYAVTSAVDNANSAKKTVKDSADIECVAYTHSMKKESDERMEIISRVSIALDQNEFVVYLQPKISLVDDSIVGAEALVRWIKPDGTMIYPDKFIPLFEENGTITKIDFYVLQEVLIYLRRRLDKKLKVVPISVNFSRKHQINPQFANDIIALLNEYGIPEYLIEIEVTEYIFVNDIEGFQKNIVKLKEKGISISIDDFGSGYSSLNILSTIQADVIKIDQAFLKRDDKKGHTVLRSLIHMIKDLGFQVIVEGAETREQVRFLKGTDCDMVQGYFFAKPMPMEEFDEFSIKK